MYRDFAVNEAAIPVIAGRKSRMESFAGADETLTIEGMMGDRKALQVGCTLSTGVCLAWQGPWWALHGGVWGTQVWAMIMEACIVQSAGGFERYACQIGRVLLQLDRICMRELVGLMRTA